MSAARRPGNLSVQATELSACAERSACEIHTAVVAAVHKFRGQTPQQDDITLVIIKAL